MTSECFKNVDIEPDLTGIACAWLYNRPVTWYKQTTSKMTGHIYIGRLEALYEHVLVLAHLYSCCLLQGSSQFAVGTNKTIICKQFNCLQQCHRLSRARKYYVLLYRISNEWRTHIAASRKWFRFEKECMLNTSNPRCQPANVNAT